MFTYLRPVPDLFGHHPLSEPCGLSLLYDTDWAVCSVLCCCPLASVAQCETTCRHCHVPDNGVGLHVFSNWRCLMSESQMWAARGTLKPCLTTTIVSTHHSIVCPNFPVWQQPTRRRSGSAPLGGGEKLKIT